MLQYKKLNLGLVLLLVFGLTGESFQGQAKAAEPTPSYMTNIVNNSLTGDGKTLVWAGYSANDTAKANSNIYGLDVASGKEFVIADTPAAESMPEIDGNFVVWSEKDGSNPARLMGKDLVSGQKFVLAASTATGILWNWSVSGDTAEWVVRSNGGKSNFIYTRNLQTLAEPVLVYAEDQPSNYVRTIYASLTGKYLIFQTANENYSDCKLNSYVKVTSNAQPRFIAQNVVPAVCQFAWAVKDNLLIYADLQSVSLSTFNLETGAQGGLLTRPLSNENTGTLLDEIRRGSTAYSITYDGRYIVWESSAYSTPGLYGYDLNTNSAFKLYLGEKPAEAVINSRPTLAGGGLYWEETSGPKESEITVIKSRPFSSTLPTPAQTAPVSYPDVLYYKESGHSLAEPFKSFWERNGGLSVFGFPSTEQMAERSQETGEVYLVQYFERQRFEYHPENKGTPYEVLLGLLGSAEADRRGLSGKGVFLPVADTRKAGCKYFEAVRHTVCGKFYDYWRANGLELGDPGLTEPEALALFGYPISEVFADPQTGLQVQYFERARFELHPENAGTPYEVLLGRLAINSLVERDWLKV